MNLIFGVIVTLIANALQAMGMVVVQMRMQEAPPAGGGKATAAARPMRDVVRDPLWYAGYVTMLGAICLNVLAFSYVPASIIAALGGSTVLFTMAVAHRFTAFRVQRADRVLAVLIVVSTGATFIILAQFPPVDVTPESAQAPGVIIAAGLFVVAVVTAATHRSLWTYTVVLGSFGGVVALLMTFINLDRTNVARLQWSVPVTLVVLTCESLIFNYVCRFFAIATVTVLYYAVYVTTVTLGSILLFMDTSAVGAGVLAGLCVCVGTTCCAVVKQGMRLHAKIR